MCRLFGLCAVEPVTATFWLLQAPDSLRAQSRREPDGTGLGYFDGDGRPHVDKQALAAYEDRAFAREARAVTSSRFVAHVRYASTGANELVNTHPFAQHGRIFAHNGVVADLPQLERRIGDAIDLVHGATDSERLFALITTEIDRHGGDVNAGIKAAVEWVAASLPVLSLNFVLIADGQLWALRYPDTHELYVLHRPPGARRGEPLEQVSSHGTRIHADRAAQQATIVIASEVMDADPGWRALAPGELIHVGPTLETSTRVVIDRPPAQPLSLADLSAHARASQG